MTAKYTANEAKDAAREMLEGIWVAYCVPETPSFEIDEAALRRDIRRYIDVLGVGGLYVHGFFGNFWLMTIEERKRVTEISIDEAGGEVPVSIRCAHASLKDAIDLVRHAEASGADLISLVGPAMADGSEAMIRSYVEEIAAATNLGISLFNTEQAGYTMRPEFIAELATIPNVAAIKSGTGEEDTATIRQLVGDSIVVIQPGEKHLLENMREHGQRAIYTGANMMYDNGEVNRMRDYVAAALAGDFDTATRLFGELDPVRQLHEEWITVPWRQRGLCPVARVKYWSEVNGLSGGPARPPLDNLTEEDKAEFRDKLSAIGALPRQAQPA